ncbi:MAG: hypothetical protein H0U67_00070 [Gemmatimonadetes bacterium]|nr:hypothetical protein [Gemmatimonadota bacterium]
MTHFRSPWIYVIAAIVGCVALGIGIGRMMAGLSMMNATWAVLGFLVLGWALLDRRKYRRGTPESEIDGGRTIE